MNMNINVDDRDDRDDHDDLHDRQLLGLRKDYYIGARQTGVLFFDPALKMFMKS